MCYPNVRIYFQDIRTHTSLPPDGFNKNSAESKYYCQPIELLHIIPDMEPDTDELIPTRATLLHRLKDHQDNASWQLFIDTYKNLIHGVATKAGLSATEAEEVVQETVISVSKHMPSFKYDQSIGSFKGWLLNLARWRIADQVRKRSPHLAEQPAPETSTDSVVDVRGAESPVDPVCPAFEAMWDAEWEKYVMDLVRKKVKRQLDPQKYQIYDFYVNKQWPPEKIAATFGIPISQVYLAKHRVIELIAEEVKLLNLPPA